MQLFSACFFTQNFQIQANSVMRQFVLLLVIDLLLGTPLRAQVYDAQTQELLPDVLIHSDEFGWVEWRHHNPNTLLDKKVSLHHVGYADTTFMYRKGVEYYLRPLVLEEVQLTAHNEVWKTMCKWLNYSEKKLRRTEKASTQLYHHLAQYYLNGQIIHQGILDSLGVSCTRSRNGFNRVYSNGPFKYGTTNEGDSTLLYNFKNFLRFCPLGNNLTNAPEEYYSVAPYANKKEWLVQAKATKARQHLAYSLQFQRDSQILSAATLDFTVREAWIQPYNRHQHYFHNFDSSSTRTVLTDSITMRMEWNYALEPYTLQRASMVFSIFIGQETHMHRVLITHFGSLTDWNAPSIQMRTQTTSLPYVLKPMQENSEVLLPVVRFMFPSQPE